MIINCDLGECLTPNLDTDIMPLIGMANIACGGHAGNDQSMVDAIRLAVNNNVSIGVHPSYADKANFGRVSHTLSEGELFDLIHTQVMHFQNLCHQNGATLEYIKPHGALYHDMTHQPSVLGVMCKVIESIDSNLTLVVQAGNEDHFKKFENNQHGGFLREVFADRAYDGLHLISRTEKEAVLSDADRIIEQFWRFSSNTAHKIDTICFHSDNPASVEALIRLKNA